jgi:hypothetical protein
MDEIEVPTEHLHEAIHESIEKEHKHVEKGWSLYVAISTALMAVFAAISSLLAGHHSNESLVSQIKASDQWSYYQSKGIKAEIKKLETNYHQATQEDIDRYSKEQEAIKKEAEELQSSSSEHLESEKKFAMAVTFFQISIAVAAISILSKKKFLWIGSLIIGTAGLLVLLVGIFSGHY